MTHTLLFETSRISQIQVSENSNPIPVVLIGVSPPQQSSLFNILARWDVGGGIPSQTPNVIRPNSEEVLLFQDQEITDNEVKRLYIASLEQRLVSRAILNIRQAFNLGGGKNADSTLGIIFGQNPDTHDIETHQMFMGLVRW